MISVYLLLDFARAKNRIEPQGNTLQRNTISRICSASPIFCIFGAAPYPVYSALAPQQTIVRVSVNLRCEGATANH